MTRWVSITTFLPLAGAAVLLILGRELRDSAARWFALAVSVATFAASLGIYANVDRTQPGFQLVERLTWVKSLGIQYLVGIDGVSMWMILLTAFLMPLSLLASWRTEKNIRLFMVSFLILETGMIGTFAALDLLLFFLFFEAILFPMYLMIGAWGGERRVYAAVKFFLYTMAGSALLLVAILFLYFRSGAGGAHPTFDLVAFTAVAHHLPAATARWLFLAFFVAFAVKVPVFPLHTWLPDAHTEAPTAGSVILAGVLLKVGAYGLIRFNLALFPEASRHFAGAVSVLAVIGIIYGAVVAIMQTDIKRLVAYSSVSHLGFVVLGIFSFTNQAMAGAVLQMVNHGLSTGALFLLVGMVYERTHTRNLDEMGGLAAVTPWLTGAFLFAVLASVGLPGLNNFVGEFLVILGSFAANKVFGSLAAVAVVLAAIYLLWSYQRMAHGTPREEHRGLLDVSAREVVVLAPILAMLVVLGVYPKLVLDRTTPTTDRVVAAVGSSHQADVANIQRIVIEARP